MEETFGLHEGAAPHADAEEQAIRSVHADEPGGSGLRHRLPVHEGPSSLLWQPSFGHAREGGVEGEEIWAEVAAVARVTHEAPGRRVLQPVRTHPRPYELSERPAAAERGPEIGGEGAHVEALAAAHADHDIRRGEALQIDAVHHDLAGRALDLYTLARQLVEPAPVVMESGIHGRYLLDRAHEAAERRGHRDAVEGRHGPRLQHGAREVLSVRGDAEAHRGQVFLVEIDEIGRELGRLADQDGQKPGGGGIEGAAMPDLGGAQGSAELRHDLERGDARALVDGEHPGAGLAPHVLRPVSSASFTAARSSAVASASVPESVQPAAFSCPPPPKRWAMALTGTSPLARRLAFTRPGSSSRRRTATLTPPMERG